MRRSERRKRKDDFITGVVTGLLLSLTSLLFWWHLPVELTVAASHEAPEQRDEKGVAEPVHVLVLGVDERQNDAGRSDTMMLVRFAGDEVRVLSIPRDTRLEIPGYGPGKANSAYTYGGPALAKEAVGEMLGVDVQYYAKVNLAGFRELVDLMGGVEINVPKAMQYTDPTDGLNIDLQPGLQRLDGDKAEQFVRFRYDEIGDDMGRIARQQQFLKAAAAQALTPRNLPRLPQLVQTAFSYAETDLPVTELVKLAWSGYNASQRNAVLLETVPGHGEYVEEISYYLVDQPELQRLLSLWRQSSAQS